MDTMTDMPTDIAPLGARGAELDDDVSRAEANQRWLDGLRGEGRSHERAVEELHGLLLRACRHEATRRARALGIATGPELDDLAQQCADDAVVAVLGRLGDFEGRSRFTTWAYKFAIHVTGVAVRREAWRARELPTSDDAIERLHAGIAGPEPAAERSELVRALLDAVARLTPRQRDVLLALAVNGVPIDVLASRLSTTRGALYKCLHDARRSLRAQLAEVGFDPQDGGVR
jgi:RNA polymerase sigma-70 factor (ECF subfamily)